MKSHTSRLLLLVSLLFIGVGKPLLSQIGQTPEAAMRRIIVDFQNGTVNWNFIAPPLKQTIALQTNGTGIYPQLIALGPPTKITLLNSISLPSGFYRVFRVDFKSIETVWQSAIDFQGVIWGLSFQPAPSKVGGYNDGSQPSEGDDDKPPKHSGGGNTPAKPPSTTSKACTLYPNLC